MTSPDLAERYGTASRGWSRVLVVAVGVVALVFLGWLAWTAWTHASPAASSALVTYDVVDEHAAVARIEVELRDDDVVATCLLRATAEDHTIVGELSFEVRAADLADGATLEREVRTERRATTVQLLGCTAPGQTRFR